VFCKYIEYNCQRILLIVGYIPAVATTGKLEKAYNGMGGHNISRAG
jgi:hypothetical protein